MGAAGAPCAALSARNAVCSLTVVSPMSVLRRVLVATDFSPSAARAVARMRHLPLAANAAIALVHVLPPRGLGGPRPRVADVRARLRAVRDELPCKSTIEVLEGDPYVEIIRAARRMRAELVVLGRHSSGRRGLVLGTTAERVVQKGSTPTLVVQADPAGSYARPVVAVDLSDVTPTILALARLVLGPGAPLRLVHAYHVPFQGFMGMSVSRRELAEFRGEYRERAHAALARIVAEHEEESKSWRVALRVGEPASVLLREIDKRSSDVVVLGTHGRSGLSHLLLGSVAETILRSAPCDVLVGRPERFTFELP